MIYGRSADGVAPLWAELHGLGRDACLGGEAEADAPFGFVLRAAWACDAGDGDGDIGAGPGEGALGHLGRDFLRHSTVGG